MLAFIAPLSDPDNWQQLSGNATPEACAAEYADVIYELTPK